MGETSGLTILGDVLKRHAFSLAVGASLAIGSVIALYSLDAETIAISTSQVLKAMQEIASKNPFYKTMYINMINVYSEAFVQ